MLGARFDPGLCGKGLPRPGSTPLLSLLARQQSGWGMRASVRDVNAPKMPVSKVVVQAPRCFTHFLCPLPMCIFFLAFISVLPM